uniref:Lifeguard protein 1 n=1 Tax=Carica papaya TaxID=3649 RepID=A0A7S9C1A1_CARPA|nr:lifeguard protein 1 [Carica papaya]
MGKHDVESGLYPTMNENPQFRWAFIRKVYIIIALQLLLTAAVASVVVFVPRIPDFVLRTPAGLAIYIGSVILSLILLCPLYVFHKKHPVNLILLVLFTVTFSFGVGLSCAFAPGKVILQAVILTSVMVTGLTLYTFWAVKRGQDFKFLGPFLFGSLLVLCFFGIMQVFFPFGKITTTIYSGLAALLFCAYIVYDTDELIKRYTYDEYICAAVSLYLDIVNLFLALLNILRVVDA